jgi:hypothetical protein
LSQVFVAVFHLRLSLSIHFIAWRTPSHSASAAAVANEVATVWPKIILEPSDAAITMDAIQRLLTTGSTAVTLMCRPQ